MGVLNVESLMAASPRLAIERIDVPEFGDDMIAWIAELSANEKEARIELPWLEHKKECDQENDVVGFRSFVVAACLCQSEARDFAAQDAKTIHKVAELLGRHGKAINRMYLVADRLNAVSEREIEGIEKNSPPASVGSGT